MAATVGDVAGSDGDEGYLDLDELIEFEQDARQSVAAKLMELNGMRTRAEITEAEFNRRKNELFGTA